MPLSPFHFKQFSISQEDVVHPVGTDGVLLGAWADVQGAKRILDIGTGTGLVALMLAQRTAAQGIEEIIGLELDQKTAMIATENAQKSAWKEHIHIIHCAVQDYVANQPFDLIVSNPPFFTDVLISPDERRNLGRHTQSLPFSDLLHCALNLLAPHGRCCVVLPAVEGLRLCEMAVPLGLYWTKISHVHARKDKPVERWLIQLERVPQGFKREKIHIYASDGGYSAEFARLTKDFYLAR